MPDKISGRWFLGNSINRIAKIAIINPIIKDPESPMKILAGEKLKTRNANNDPPRAKARLA